MELERRAAAGEVRAQIELAARRDAAGQHDEAIDLLTRAGRAGDPEALRILGLRLMTGKNAPPLPVQGAKLLAESARGGDPLAASMTAVLLGGGFFAPQMEQGSRLPAALRRGGGVAAQAQLAIMTIDPRLAALASTPHPDDDLWRRLRQGVDVSAWTGAPPGQALSQTPLVKSVKGLIPHQACDWIIEQSRNRLIRAEVHDPRTGKTIMGQTRTNRVANFELVDTSQLNLFIQAKISAASGAPTRMMEAFAILNYAVGEEASEHFDYLEPSVPAYAAEIAQLGQRVATCLLYLNDDYEGGETGFPELGIRHRGGKGDALIFFSADDRGTPDPRTVHAGRPPTAGEKWVLSQFIRNRAIAPGSS